METTSILSAPQVYSVDPTDQRVVWRVNSMPYTAVACLAWLAYDYICTLDREVKYVWTSRISIGTVLFYANRYLPFIDTVMSIYHVTSTTITPEGCKFTLNAQTWLVILGTVISEAILVLRTYAIWERRWSILLILIGMLGIVTPVAVVICAIQLSTIVYEPAPAGQVGCWYARAPSRIIYVAYVVLIISESVIAVLTLIRAPNHLRRTVRGSWVYVLYRDGFLFYGYLIAVTFANAIVSLAGPYYLHNWLASPVRIMHSVVCTRIIFLILSRAHTHDQSEASSQTLSQSWHHPKTVFTTFFSTLYIPSPEAGGNSRSQNDDRVAEDVRLEEL